MSRERFRYLDLVAGQNDTRVEEGTELPQWPVVRNTRYPGGVPARRKGRKRIAVCGTDATSLSFVAASSQYIAVPAHDVHALGLGWTMEFLFNPDLVSGTEMLFGFGHATDYPFKIWSANAKLKVQLVPSTGSALTLTSTTTVVAGTSHYARVTRDADDLLSLYMDDSTTAEDTNDGGLNGYDLFAAGGELQIARNNAGNYYDGQIDYFRAMSYVQPDSSMAFTRWPSPRASYMLWNYGGELDTNSWVHDLSQYENHGLGTNTPTTATTLCVNPAPVQLIRSRRDKDNKTKVFIIAGGRPMDAEV